MKKIFFLYLLFFLLSGNREIISMENLCSNSGFEILNEKGLPADWDIYIKKESKYTEVKVEIYKDAHTKNNSLRLRLKGKGTIFLSRKFITGLDKGKLIPLKKGESIFHYKILFCKVKENNSAFYIRGINENLTPTAQRYNFEISKLKNKWQKGEIRFDYSNKEEVKYVDAGFEINNKDKDDFVDILIDDFSIYKIGAKLKIISAGISPTVIFENESAEIKITLQNVGDEEIKNLSANLNIKNDFSLEDEKIKEIKNISPDKKNTLKWKIKFNKEEKGKIPIVFECPSIKKEIVFINYVVSKEMPEEKSWDSQFKILEEENLIILKNEKMRILFLKNDFGYGICSFEIYQNKNWNRVAMLPSFSQIIYENKGEIINENIYANQYKIVNNKNKLGLKFSSLYRNNGVKFNFEFHFYLQPSSNIVEVNYNVKSAKPIKLLKFKGPYLLIGERNFGSKKEEAILPGLEYLKNDEYSSGEYFAHPPYNLRIIPHPYKITIPLIALTYNEHLISIFWNPLQKWDNKNKYPAVRFCSPNYLEEANNHLFELFLPSLPYLKENEEITQDYIFKSPLTLSAKFYFDTTPDITKILEEWIRVNNIPEMPKIKISYEDALLLSIKSLLEVNWDNEKKCWLHTNTGPTFFDPIIAQELWKYYLRCSDITLKNKIKNQVEEALKVIDRKNTGIELPFYFGLEEEILKSWENLVKEYIKIQKEDGSFPFLPDEKHKIFGEPFDTSSGLTAEKAITILKIAKITGNSEDLSAGIKALNFLDNLKRPEGAQVWELSLHIPDVLASAHLVSAYLEGYEITKEKKYLEKAIYWAKTGLPFIYLWNAKDRPIMKYGSIPVFGVTYYDVQPWFGILVQWNGLVYAHSLWNLGEYDNSLPWRKIAEGITSCAIQLQQKSEKFLGMYPDAYSIVKGKDEYTWWLNPRLIPPLLFYLLGENFDLKTEILEDIHLTSFAKIKNLKKEEKNISFEFEFYPEEFSYILISNIGKPKEIFNNEKLLQDWKYFDKYLIIKIEDKGKIKILF